jgi:hypothetical protein
VFPTPDSTSAGLNVYIQYQAPFEDFDDAANNADIPQEFLRALKYQLAVDLSFEFGYPATDRRELMATAERYKQQVFSFNQEEESITFQVDRRNW